MAALPAPAPLTPSQRQRGLIVIGISTFFAWGGFFMGIPLVQSVLGEEYVFYISACMAGQVPLIWSYGIWLISQDASKISPK